MHRNKVFGFALTYLVVGCVSPVAWAADSQFSDTVIANSPLCYYQMDAASNPATFTDTMGNVGNLSGQGGGSLYAETNGAPLTGVTGQNRAFFTRQSGSQGNNPAPDGGAPSSQSYGTTALPGASSELQPNQAFSACMFVKFHNPQRQVSKDPVFLSQTNGAGNGGINGIGLQSGVDGPNAFKPGWAFFARDTDNATTSGAVLSFEWTDGQTNFKRWMSSVDLLDGEWHFIGFSYDGAGNLTLYHEGQPVATSVEMAGAGIPASVSGSNIFGIGSKFASHNVFNGLIDEVAFFIDENILSDEAMNYLHITVPVELSEFALE